MDLGLPFFVACGRYAGTTGRAVAGDAHYLDCNSDRGLDSGDTVAEELAYRDYLMRRLVSEDFESVPFHKVRWPVVVLMALVFGLAHGTFWLPGIAAGLAFGFILVRRKQHWRSRCCSVLQGGRYMVVADASESLSKIAAWTS